MQVLRRSNPKLRSVTAQLFEARTLDEQVAYERLRPSLWTAFDRWLVGQPLTMALTGVPRPRMRLIEGRSPGGIAAYLQEKLERVLPELPTRGILRHLRQRLGRLSTHTTTVSRLLERHPGVYSHFVLLDQQDWLASHDPAGLEEEWRLLLGNSRPGTRDLMRSASPEIDFIPAAVRAATPAGPRGHVRIDVAGGVRLNPSGTDAPQAYQRWHAGIYDWARWSFLFGRGELARFGTNPRRILELVCGTGANLVRLAITFPAAEIVGLDGSGEMLLQAQPKLARFGTRLELRHEFYESPVAHGGPSISSMINPGYQSALRLCRDDLDDRAGVLALVGFHDTGSRWFQTWMGRNHVRLNGQIHGALRASGFEPAGVALRSAYGGLWPG